MYTDIKFYEDACKDQGKDPAGIPDYSKCELTPQEEQFNLAVFRFARIAVSINKEKGKVWKPKPTDDKYYSWMWIKKDATKRSGFGLSFCDAVDGSSLAFVASRLTFRDEARAKYMFDTFPELHEDIFIFQ